MAGRRAADTGEASHHEYPRVRGRSREFVAEDGGFGGGGLAVIHHGDPYALFKTFHYYRAVGVCQPRRRGRLVRLPPLAGRATQGHDLGTTTRLGHGNNNQL